MTSLTDVTLHRHPHDLWLPPLCCTVLFCSVLCNFSFTEHRGSARRHRACRVPLLPQPRHRQGTQQNRTVKADSGGGSQVTMAAIEDICIVSYYIVSYCTDNNLPSQLRLLYYHTNNFYSPSISIPLTVTMTTAITSTPTNRMLPITTVLSGVRSCAHRDVQTVAGKSRALLQSQWLSSFLTYTLVLLDNPWFNHTSPPLSFNINVFSLFSLIYLSSPIIPSPFI